jgi:hypothetical protein
VAVPEGTYLLLLQVRGLKRTALILPENYPSFTLLRQAVGAIKLGCEALTLLVPEVGTLLTAVCADSKQLTGDVCWG